MLQTIVSVAQLVIAVLLVVLILLQERESGLSGVFGGSEGGYYRTRRGLERFIFATTIVLLVVFVVLSLLTLVI